MSKSGVPVISQTAQATSVIASSVGGIFSGDNVFESVAKIVAAPTAATQAQLDQVTFGKLRSVPIIGPAMVNSPKLLNDPSAKNLEAYYKSEAVIGATVAGAFAGGVPGAAAAGGAASKLSEGKDIGSTLTGFVGDQIGLDTEWTDALGGLSSSLLTNTNPKAPGIKNYTNNAIASPEAAVSAENSSYIFVMLFLAIGVFFIFKMRKS